LAATIAEWSAGWTITFKSGVFDELETSSSVKV
jgi:hypothetical protein